MQFCKSELKKAETWDPLTLMDHRLRAGCLRDLQLPKDTDVATIKKAYLRQAYEVHPKRCEANNNEAIEKFRKFSRSCYIAITTRGVCNICSTVTCKDCGIITEEVSKFEHILYDHKEENVEEHYELLYYYFLEDLVCRHRFMPKKKREKASLTEEDEKLFEFFDHLTKVTVTDCLLCQKAKKSHSEINCSQEKDVPQPCEVEQQTEATAATTTQSDTRERLIDQNSKRSHRSRLKSRRRKNQPSVDGDCNNQSHNSSEDIANDHRESHEENRESRKKRENRQESKRRSELEAIRSELLKKIKIVEVEKIQKPHIILPQEIIPKNIKKEIERQHKEAERRKRDHERRMRQLEARELKMEKKMKRATKRKQAVLNQTNCCVEEESSMEEKLLFSSASTTSSNLSSAADSSSPMEVDSGAAGSGTDKMTAQKSTLLQKHLQEYHELMKEQPRRHTRQQLEEERRRLQEAAAHKQREELSMLRNKSSSQGSGRPEVEQNERRAILEKLREKEKQRNIEEMEETEYIVKKAKNTNPQMMSGARKSVIKPPTQSQIRSARGRGRSQAAQRSSPSNQIISWRSEPAACQRLKGTHLTPSVDLDSFTSRENTQKDERSMYDQQEFFVDTWFPPFSPINCSVSRKELACGSNKDCSSIGYAGRNEHTPQKSFNENCLPSTTTTMQHSTPFSSQSLLYSDCLKQQSTQLAKANEKAESLPVERPTFQTRDSPREREKQDQSRHSILESYRSSSKYGFGEKDTLVPAPTMDDWIKSRKAASTKVSRPTCKTSKLPGSSGSSVQSKSDDTERVYSFHSNKSIGSEDEGSINNNTDSRPAMGTNSGNSDLVSLMQKMNMSNDCRETKNTTNSDKNVSHSNSSKSDDWLAHELNGLSLKTKFEQDPQDKNTTNLDRREFSTTSLENSKQTKEVGATAAAKVLVSFPFLQNQAESLVARSSMLKPRVAGQVPGCSYPAGVYPSDEVQHMAFSLQQQQQQLLLMSYDLQARMIMLASASAAQPDQEPKRGLGVHNSASTTALAVNSAGVNTVPLGACKPRGRAPTSVVDASAIAASWADGLTSGGHELPIHLASLGKTARKNEKPSFPACKVGKDSERKELSDQEVHEILTKVSNLSCHEKPVQSIKIKNLVPISQKACEVNKNLTDRSAGKAAILVSPKKENWEEGIRLDSKCLLPSSNKSTSTHPAPVNQLSSEAASFLEEKSLPSTLYRPVNTEDIELPENKVKAILKKVPILISEPSVSQGENASLLSDWTKNEDISTGCRRPLRRPTSTMRCRRSQGLLRSTPETERTVHIGANHHCFEPEELPSLLSRDLANEKLSEKRHSNNPLTQSKMSLETISLDPATPSKTKIKNLPRASKVFARRKPDNPARLMKAALCQVGRSDEESRQPFSALPLTKARKTPSKGQVMPTFDFTSSDFPQFKCQTTDAGEIKPKDSLKAQKHLQRELLKNGDFSRHTQTSVCGVPPDDVLELCNKSVVPSATMKKSPAEAADSPGAQTSVHTELSQNCSSDHNPQQSVCGLPSETGNHLFGYRSSSIEQRTKATYAVNQMQSSGQAHFKKIVSNDVPIVFPAMPALSVSKLMPKLEHIILK